MDTRTKKVVFRPSPPTTYRLGGGWVELAEDGKEGSGFNFRPNNFYLFLLPRKRKGKTSDFFSRYNLSILHFSLPPLPPPLPSSSSSENANGLICSLRTIHREGNEGTSILLQINFPLPPLLLFFPARRDSFSFSRYLSHSLTPKRAYEEKEETHAYFRVCIVPMLWSRIHR